MTIKTAKIALISGLVTIGVLVSTYATSRVPNPSASLEAHAPENMQIHSGETITLVGQARLLNSNENLEYQWIDLKDGTQAMGHQQSMLWTAPEVSTPTRLAFEFSAISSDFVIPASDVVIIEVLPKQVPQG